MIHGRQPARGAPLRVLAVLAAAVWGLAAPLRGQDPSAPAAATDLEAGLCAAERELVAGLEALVPWCTKERLFARREALCEEILTLSPESEVAHEGLLHQRDRDGNWEPPKKRSPVKDYTRSQVPVFDQRRAELGEAFVAAVLALTAPPPAAATGPPAFLDEAARAALERALEVAPDHVGLRARFGEVRAGEAWVLAETLRGRERRAELAQLVAAALAAVPAPEAIEPEARELATEVPWQVSIATPWVRVLSTGTADEAERMARAAHAAIAVFREVFGTATELNPGFTIFVLANEPDRALFISGWPSLGPAALERMAGFVGAAVPMSQHTACWDPDPVNRLDSTIRHTLGELFRTEFRLGVRQAWAWEGFGIYLTRALVGTCRTWNASLEGLDPETKQLASKLMNVGEADWVEEAHELVLAGRASALDDLLTRPITSLGVHDLLLAYGLAAYLLEGHPDQLTALLRATVTAGSSATAFELVLRRPLAELDQRFPRWLGERR